MRNPVTTHALAALTCLVLAGCSGGSTPLSPAPSMTPTPGSSATPSPIVTPSPSPATAVAEIDFDRFLNIYVGMSFADASAASGIPLQGEAMCPWFTNIVVDDPPGLHVAATSPVEAVGTEIWFFRMLWLNDPALAPPGLPRTVEGITIGSTEAEVLAAYPTAVLTSVDDMSRGPRTFYLVAGPTDLTLIFDVNSGLVTEITWGKRLTYGPPGEMCAL